MFAFLSRLLKKPSAKTLAQQHIEEAEREMLTHEAAAAYHQKLAEYYGDTVRRLTLYTQGA